MYNLENFSKVKVLVVGDVMIDKYLWGDVRRISPEAPVPVVNLKSETLIAGGAANVAANVVGLNAEAFLIGLTGNDVDGDIFGQVLKEIKVSDKYIVRTQSRQTTVKTRIMAHNQQIARLDQETILDLTPDEEKKILKKFNELAEKADVVVVSDYGKGVLSGNLLAKMIKSTKESRKTVLIDPKGKDYDKYSSATLITPNKFELAEVCGCNPESLEELQLAGLKMLKKLDLEALIITRGEDGLTLLSKNRKPFTIKALKRKVYDVTGAGDTFISALAVALGAGNDLRTTAEVANIAAGLVVEELGTTTIKFDRLQEILNN